jgi:hypothetical protein
MLRQPAKSDGHSAQGSGLPIAEGEWRVTTKMRSARIISLIVTRLALFVLFGSGTRDYASGSWLPIALKTEVLRLLFFFLAGVFAWAAWPISAWFGLTLLIAILLVACGRQMARLSTTGVMGRFAGILTVAFENLGKAALSVAIGVALVCVAQIALSFFENIAVSSLSATEDFLSNARSSLHRLIGFENFWIGLAGIVAASMLLPKAQLLPSFLSIRSSLVTVYFILVGLTSFTFFSVRVIENQEARSMQRLRPVARPYLEERSRLSREILGAAWTEKIVKELRRDQQEAVSPYFTPKEQHTIPIDLIRPLAKRLAATAPRLEPNSAAETADVRDPVKRVRSYLVPGTTITHDSPTLPEAKSGMIELKTEVERLRVLRQAAIDIVAEGLTEVLTGTIDKPLTQAFVEELVSSLARGALHPIMPSVANLDRARAWVQANIDVPKPVSLKPASTKWTWDSATLTPEPANVPTDIPPPVRASSPNFDSDPHVFRPHEAPLPPRQPVFEPARPLRRAAFKPPLPPRRPAFKPPRPPTLEQILPRPLPFEAILPRPPAFELILPRPPAFLPRPPVVVPILPRPPVAAPRFRFWFR